MRELEDTDRTSVTAAVSIRREEGVTPDPASVSATVHEAIRRAAGKSKSVPHAVNVLPHLGVAVVDAPKELIRELIDQPEITGAMLSGDKSGDDGSP